MTYLKQQGASFDEDGMPTVGTAVWSDPIECYIDVNTHNNKGTYQDGMFTQATYEVLIERQALDIVPNRIRLTRSSDVVSQMDLGEWEVQNFESIHLDRIKITV